MKDIPYGKQAIDEDDIDAVVKVLRSDFLTQGPQIELFEQAVASYCSTAYAVAFSSGTAALHGACFAAEIKKDYEVITSPLTFAASANCVLYCGGKPIFADIKKDLPLIDPQQIEKKITPKTRVLIPVDYSGIPADYDEINEVAKRYNLIVIADASHSFGATYKGRKVGTLVDMTVFSFHPVKTITTGEGGMVVTNNRHLYERLKLFRTHGITKDKKYLIKKNEGPWYYEMQELGFNYRLTDIQAALGVSQVKKIDIFLKKRKVIAQAYQNAFINHSLINCLYIPHDRTSAWHLFPILLNKKFIKFRKEIVEKLHSTGIRAQVHYIPVHVHPYYQRHFRYKMGDFPNTELFYKREISLPIYPQLTNEQFTYVVKIVNELMRRFS